MATQQTTHTHTHTHTPFRQVLRVTSNVQCTCIPQPFILLRLQPSTHVHQPTHRSSTRRITHRTPRHSPHHVPHNGHTAKDTSPHTLNTYVILSWDLFYELPCCLARFLIQVELCMSEGVSEARTPTAHHLHTHTHTHTHTYTYTHISHPAPQHAYPLREFTKATLLFTKMFLIHIDCSEKLVHGNRWWCVFCECTHSLLLLRTVKRDTVACQARETTLPTPSFRVASTNRPHQHKPRAQRERRQHHHRHHHHPPPAPQRTTRSLSARVPCSTLRCPQNNPVSNTKIARPPTKIPCGLRTFNIC